jgi:hypothetical protein
MQFRLEDETGLLIAESDDPSDLFDADDADDEIALALARIMDEPEVMIGGGAGPLFVLVNTAIFEGVACPSLAGKPRT